MKKRNSLVFSVLLTFSCFAQEQELSLQQIIDSALQKHPLLVNVRLVEQVNSNAHSSFLNLPPLEFSYSRGQFYSPHTDNRFEIKQSLGNPVALWAEKKAQKTKYELALAGQQMVRAKLISEIKMAYFKLQYSIELDKLYAQQYRTWQNVLGFVAKADSFATDELDLLLLETAANEAVMLSVQSYNTIIEAQNQLLHVSFLETETMPADTVFEIYQIMASTNSFSRTPAHLFNNIYNKNYEVSVNNHQLANAARYPEIFVAYGNLGINGERGFNYWSAGIALPLWTNINGNRQSQARMQREIALNERNNHRSQADAHTANLLTELNHLFEQLNYFYDFGLPQSEKLYNLVLQQFVENRGEMHKKIIALQKSYSLRLQYLNCILNYNLKAAEVELYAY